MNDALENLSKEELKSYAIMLLTGAVLKLEEDMPEEAAWRMANALGTLSTILASDPRLVPGISVPTSLGYQLSHDNDQPL